MRIKDVISELKKLQIPIKYRVFKSKPSVPFLVYYKDSSGNFIADGEVYYKAENYVLELYYDNEPSAVETKIEKTFDDLGICWVKEESYIDSEKLEMLMYYFSVEGE